MPTIKLRSNDGKEFVTDVEVAKCSTTIRTMLEDCGMDDDDNDAAVPLPNVNAAILSRVITWAEHHKDDPQPTASDKDSGTSATATISDWDANFLRVDQGTLFDLILAANYLDITGLLEVTCQTVANMIKGRSAAEIRTAFNIRDDFSASEQELAQKENEFVADWSNKARLCWI